MAGTMMRGNRRPDADHTGDIDTLLMERSGERVTERVVQLQQVQYACRRPRRRRLPCHL